MRALIYCRVSTERQEKEATAESQEREARAFAESRGLAVVRVTHEIHTGAEMHERPVLSAVRESVRNREIDALIVHSVDRLSRDAAHLLIIHDECQRADVEMLFVTESFDSTPEGKLMLSVKGFVAEVERLKIRERMTRGKRERVHRGKLINSPVPLYGYTQSQETSARTIEPTEARIVRRIFEESLGGLGALSIAQKLNREGIPSPAAGKRAYRDGRAPKWGKSVILRILREPAYTGESVALRWKAEKVKGRRVFTERPREEWKILDKDLTPAIITQEQFDQAQAGLGERRGATKRNQARPALLRGLIWCKCGRARIPDQDGYRCGSRDSAEGRCGSGATPRIAVEVWAWGEIEKLIRNPARVEAALSERLNVQLSDKDGLAERIRQIEAALAKIGQQQQRLIARFADADDALAELIEAQIRKLTADRAALTVDLESLRRQLAAEDARAVQFAGVAEICRKLAEVESPTFAQKRAALLAFGVRIVADAGADWTLELEFDFPESGESEGGGSGSGERNAHNILLRWANLRR